MKVLGTVEENTERLARAIREHEVLCFFTGITKDGKPGNPIAVPLSNPNVISLEVQPDHDLISRVALPSMGDIRNLRPKS